MRYFLHFIVIRLSIIFRLLAINFLPWVYYSVHLANRFVVAFFPSSPLLLSCSTEGNNRKKTRNNGIFTEVYVFSQFVVPVEVGRDLWGCLSREYKCKFKHKNLWEETEHP